MHSFSDFVCLFAEHICWICWTRLHDFIGHIVFKSMFYSFILPELIYDSIVILVPSNFILVKETKETIFFNQMLFIKHIL